MATEQKKKLTQAEKAVLKEGYDVEPRTSPVDAIVDEETTKNIKNTINDAEKKSWWKKILDFIGDVIAGVIAIVALPFMTRKEKEVIVDTSGLETKGVYEKAKEQIQKQEELIAEKEKALQNDSQQKDGADIITIVPDTPEEVVDENENVLHSDTVIPDVIEDVVVEDTIIEDTEAVETLEFVATKCETFEQLQKSIKNIDENVSLTVTENNCLSLSAGEYNVEFSMDELNADGLSDCIHVNKDIANAITHQMEENLIVIRLKLEEKSVAELVEKLKVENEQEKIIATMKEICDADDKIKDFKLNPEDKSINFNLEVDSGFDAVEGQCIQNLVQILLTAEPTIRQAQEFSNPMTGEHKYVGPQDADISKLPVAIRAIAEFMKNEQIRANIFSEKETEKPSTHESLKQFRNRKRQERESSDMATEIPAIDKSAVKDENELKVAAQRACAGRNGIRNVSLEDAVLMFSMTVDFKNDRDADGRGCISDVISIDIRTGKIEREKIYNDYDRLGESSETFAMKPTELPEAAKVVFELTQDKAIQGLFPKQEKSQKSEFSAGDEVLNDDFGGKHKEHKKDNRRRNGQKERAFAAQLESGQMPETKQQKRAKRAHENGLKYMAERNARENGDSR